MRIAIALFCAGQLLAQTPPAPRFEVATLKLAPPPEGDLININLGNFRSGRLTLSNVTLKDAMKFAYELSSDEQLVAPDWNRTVRFDIEALAPPSTSPQELHRMTQALLAERLHLVLRREQRVVRYLALVAAKGDPKLKVAGKDPVPVQGPQIRGRIKHDQMPMGQLAALLSRFERQTIVDLTELAGLYKIRLEWAPDSNLPAEDLNTPPPERPGLFAALQEQLGLRLEPRRGALEVIVVEQASKVPEAN
jgi:uncharacterized protein (TIGR03435 family)